MLKALSCREGSSKVQALKFAAGPISPQCGDLRESGPGEVPHEKFTEGVSLD